MIPFAVISSDVHEVSVVYDESYDVPWYLVPS